MTGRRILPALWANSAVTASTNGGRAEDPCSQQPPATLSCDPDRQPDGCQRAQQNAARKEPELRHAEPVNAVGQTVRHALPRLQRRDEHQQKTNSVTRTPQTMLQTIHRRWYCW